MSTLHRSPRWECKNQEAVNVWKAYEQAESNCKGYEPLVVIKRNRSKPLVLVDAEHFVKLHKKELTPLQQQSLEVGNNTK